jgi:type VI secretion system protein ImpB
VSDAEDVYLIITYSNINKRRFPMAESFQKEKPPARINLFLEVQKGDAKKKMELPLRLLVTGQFSDKDKNVPLDRREKININKDNFNDVMKSSDLGVEMTVADKLKGGDAEMKVNLKFNDLKSFHPEEVAKQVPQLIRLMATRNLLQDLRNRIISINDFRKELERIVKDKAALAKLSEELNKLTPPAPQEPAKTS